LAFAIEDGENADKGKFPDGGHGGRRFPPLDLPFADPQERGEIFLKQAVGGAQFGGTRTRSLLGCLVQLAVPDGGDADERVLGDTWYGLGRFPVSNGLIVDTEEGGEVLTAEAELLALMAKLSSRHCVFRSETICGARVTMTGGGRICQAAGIPGHEVGGIPRPEDNASSSLRYFTGQNV
jgi:hypothetical protein